MDAPERRRKDGPAGDGRVEVLVPSEDRALPIGGFLPNGAQQTMPTGVAEFTARGVIWEQWERLCYRSCRCLDAFTQQLLDPCADRREIVGGEHARHPLVPQPTIRGRITAKLSAARGWVMFPPYGFAVGLAHSAALSLGDPDARRETLRALRRRGRHRRCADRNPWDPCAARAAGSDQDRTPDLPGRRRQIAGRDHLAGRGAGTDR